MEKIIITIKTDNSAFEPDPNWELIRILREIADKLENEYSLEDINIMDINGNCVGKVEVK
jgi:hypothetical protein